MKKKNGFTLPPHPYQILSWLLIVWHIIIPLVFTSDPLRSAFIAIYWLSTIFVIILAFFATKSNPGVQFQSTPTYLDTSDGTSFFCTICRSFVNKSSKHCSRCDKCIDNFDHHCKWLNNCIGSPNYNLFFYLIISLELNQLILIIFELCIVTQNLSSNNIIILIDCIFNTMLLILVGYLIGLHVYLKKNHLTTYEYLKIRRAKTVHRIEPSSIDTMGNRINSSENEGLVLKEAVKTHRISRTVVEKDIEWSIVHCLSKNENFNSVSFESSI